MGTPKRSKRKLINKKFQLRTTFSVLGIILIAFITLIAATAIFLTDSNRRTISALEQIKNTTGIATDIKKGERVNDSAKISFNQSERLDLIVSIRNLEDISSRNRIIITAIIGIAVLLGIVLYFYLINITHRISGPIYVLSNYIKQIMEGEKPDIRSLRKNDEFKEFYEQFIDFIERMYKKEED